MNKTISDVQEPKKSETPKDKDTYRAPRLVTLGTTVRLVQSGHAGMRFDGMRGQWM